MMEALIWAGSSLTYVLGVMISARILHIRRYREFIAWRNEAPGEAKFRCYGDYGSLDQPRSEYTLYQYLRAVNLKAPRGVCVLWPFLAPYYGIVKFCFPSVKVADPTRIKELEKLCEPGSD